MVKVSKYIITNESIKQMKNLIKKTGRDDVERGFALCEIRGKKSISVGSKCVGDDCSVNIDLSECKKKSNRIGSFHTHTDPTLDYLSFTDMNSSFVLKEKMTCIGVSSGIKCYTPTKSKGCNSSTTKKLSTKLEKKIEKIEDIIMFELETENKIKGIDYEKFSSLIDANPKLILAEKEVKTERENYLNKCFKVMELK